MAGFACSDCIFCTCMRNKKSGLYQGSCSKGYTLANPYKTEGPDQYFTLTPQQLVPTKDPFGEEYLRSHNVCAQFQRKDTQDEKAQGEVWWKTCLKRVEDVLAAQKPHMMAVSHH